MSISGCTVNPADDSVTLEHELSDGNVQRRADSAESPPSWYTTNAAVGVATTRTTPTKSTPAAMVARAGEGAASSSVYTLARRDVPSIQATTIRLPTRHASKGGDSPVEMVT